MHRSDVTAKILEALVDGAKESIYLLVAIQEAGYGASRKKIERKIEEVRSRGFLHNHPRDFERKRRNFYSMLSKLKKDGIIDKNGAKWIVTAKGKARLRGATDSLPSKKYKTGNDATLKIVIFDIPEAERAKRDWLRSQLRNIGFQIIQRSVWAGKKKIPEAFLKDLRDMRILEYIEIFTVTKGGSIEELKIH